MADLRLQMNEVRKVFDQFVAETRAKAAAEQAAHAAAMAENKGAQRGGSPLFVCGQQAAHRFRQSSVGRATAENLAKAQEAFTQAKQVESSVAARTLATACVRPLGSCCSPGRLVCNGCARLRLRQSRRRTAARQCGSRASWACCARSATRTRSSAPSSRATLSSSASRSAARSSVRRGAAGCQAEKRTRPTDVGRTVAAALRERAMLQAWTRSSSRRARWCRSTSAPWTCTRSAWASSLSSGPVRVWRRHRGCAVCAVRLTSAGPSQLVWTGCSADGGLHVTFQRVLPTQPNAECSFVLKVNDADVYEGTPARPHANAARKVHS